MFYLLANEIGNTLFSFLRDFIPIKSNITVWEIANAPISSALITGLVAWWIKGSVDGVKEVTKIEQEAKTGAATAKLEAEKEEEEIKEEIEEIEETLQETTNPSSIDNKDYRQETRELVTKTKAYIEKKVKGDTDNRHQRTYANIPRYDRSAITVALEQRDQLTKLQMKSAITIFYLWQKYERGKASNKHVSQKTYNMIKEAFDNLG